MKLSKLILIGAVVFGFGACNNTEDVPDVQKKDGTVSIRITQKGSLLKAAGVASELAVKESAIQSLDVFVFNGDAVDGYKRATGNDLNRVEGIGVTAGPRSIIVVANAPAGLGSIASKAALTAKVAEDLATQTADGGLLMTSTETGAVAIVAGENYYGYPAGQTGAAAEFSPGSPIELTRVAARVALMGVEVAFVDRYAGWKYENESVFLFNAKKQSKYFGTSLVEGGEFLSGLDLTDATFFDGPLKPAGWVTGWTASYLIDAVADYSTVSATDPVYYYTFENSDKDAPTCISLKGKLLDETGAQVTRTTHPQYPNINDIVDANGYTYYTVIVNADKVNYSYTGDTVDHDATVKRNTQYNITLKITKPGVIDPTNPVDPANLNVEVQVVPWVVVDQHVEW